MRHLLPADYWAGKLAGAERIFPSAAEAGGPPRSAVIEVPAELAGRMERTASGSDAGIFMLLLAAGSSLLRRYAGTDEPLIASTPFQQGEAEGSGLVFFRPRLSEDPCLRRLLVALRGEMEQVHQHQGFDFEQLRARLLAEAPGDGRALLEAALTCDRFNPHSPWLDRMALWLHLDRQAAGWSLRIQDGRGVFDSRFLAQAGRHLLRLLAWMLDHSEAPASGAGLLDPAEREELLDRFAGRSTPYPEERALAELLSEQAARTPEAPAVLCGERWLSYAELDRRANALAHRLIAGLEAGPDRLVGVMLDRSERLVVALCAILKAGGAYVPLDPGYPRERLAAMLEGLGGCPAIVEERYRDRLPGAPVLAVGELLAKRADPPPLRASGRHLAYAMFTSGSTGRPKAVLIEQRSVARLVLATDYVDLRPGTRILQTGSMSFDASTFEVWGALLNGGTLVLAPSEELLDAASLGRLLDRHRIDCIWLTASLFNQVVESDPSVFAPLRTLVVGGERLSPPHVERVLRAHPALALVNGYGPTEGTTFTACHRIRRVEGEIPIGRPIANTRVYVLDEEDRPAPAGVAGELLIAGDGLARGYHGRPDLTAERFVPHPFRPGGRVYRSGDRARWTFDGELEFLGRRDDQVKIRGFRVEPEEVRHRLLEHPDVRQAMVATRELPSGRALVAWAAGSGLDPAALRSHLAAVLPPFMVPAHVVTLERLPLNPNGKVDLRALPDPENPAGRGAPRDSLEQALAAIWREVLGQPEIGIDDSFFDLGGHSLNAAAITGRAHRELGLEIGLRDLFEAPTVAALAAVARQRRGEALAPIEPVSEAPDYPLSHAQRRLWILDRLTPGLAAYNLPGALRLRGPLDPDRLERAFKALLARHDSLRTVFPVEGGEPRQQILPPGDFRLQEIDLAGGEDPEGRAREIAREEAASPFDLTRGPLLRAKLLRLADDDRVLLVDLHHIVADGWSLRVLLRDLAALYGSLAEGTAPPPLRIQYRDYAAWQSALLASEAAEAHRRFWHERLSGPLPVLDLPADRPRPAARSYRGETLRHRLAPEAREGLRQAARQAGVTPFAILLSCVGVLLHRYTGEEDLLVGSTVAGRVHPDLAEQVGFFVNALPLRLRCRAAEPFAEVLRGGRDAVLAAFEHQIYPFDLLIDELRLPRDTSRSPLFDVMVNHDEGVDLEAPALPGVEVSRLPVETSTSKFDLTFDFSGDREVAVEFDTAIFEPVRIHRLLSHFATLAASLPDSLDRAVAALEILPEAERRQVLHGFNDTGADYPRQETLTTLFAARAASAPDRPAVVHGDRALAYGELEAAAAAVAGALASRVRPGELVAVLLRPSGSLIAALLGVSRAGAAYVPLDPEHPRERLAFMLADSGCRILLAEGSLLELAEAARGGTRVEEVIDVGTLAAPPPAPPVAPDPEAPAYLIYTSGSTGRPKGCLVTHRNVVRLLFNGRHPFDFGPADVWILAHSHCFDFAVWEMYGALLRGGLLVVPSREEVRDSRRFLELIRRHRVTVLNQTPAAFSNLIAEELAVPDHTLDGHLRWVIFGGDRLEPRALAAWPYPLDRVALVNMYGITETTVHVTFHRLAPEDLTEERIGSPIGVPLPETTVYVCGPAAEPMPIGVPGELYVGGSGVAAGYLDRPELTRERFVESPFRPGERLYRTGDLGRWLEGGRLEYLGRNDDQVKIRGHRIEPGEVERALLEHPAVREAFVATRPGPDGDRELVAWFTAPEGLPAETLRAHLRERLPAPLVPHRFLRLASFPLTANGKVDRRALLACPAEEEAGRETPYVAPRDPFESAVAEAFGEVLGRERVGLRDDWFSLGGDSIRAVRLAAAVHRRLGLSPDLRDIYGHPDPASLAARLWRAEARGDAATVRAGERELAEWKQALLADAGAARLPGDWEEILPMTAIEQGMVFHGLLGGGSAVYHDQFFIQIADPEFDFARFCEALARMARKHPILRTSFHLSGFSEPVQVVHRRIGLDVDCTDLSPLGGAAQKDWLERCLERDRGRPFDLARPGLWRMRVFLLGGGEIGLLWAFHHAILDGWSNASFLTELLNGYQSLRDRPGQDFGTLASTYAAYAADQRIRRRDPRSLAFWRDYLAGCPRNRLPFHRAAGAPGARGGRSTFAVEPRVAAALADLARREEAGLRHVCLAAFARLLAATTGEPSLLFGLVTHGRPAVEDGDRVLGCFLNTVPLRLEVEGDESPRELIRRVKAALERIAPHERLPLAEIRRQAAGGPLFDALFNYVDFHVADGLALGLALRPPRVESFESTDTSFDWSVMRSRDGLAVSLAHVHDEAEAGRLAAIWSRLLESFVTAPGEGLSGAELLDDAERQALRSWNDTGAGWPRDATLVDLFQAQAAQSAGRAALITGGEVWTYGRLEAGMTAVSRRLRREHAIGRGDLVAVLLDPSPRMIAAVLGVLAAGATYVPIDPAYPRERMAAMLDGVRLLLTEEPHHGRLLGWLSAAAPGLPVALLDTEDGEDTAAGATSAVPTDGAYIIYTSGSTGRPKGCLVRHAEVVRLLFNDRTPFDFGAADTWVLAHSFCFDFSVWEMYGALLHGGCLVIPRREQVRDVRAFLDLIAAHRVTVLNQTPPAFYALADEARRRGPRGLGDHLRWVIFGGDRLEPRRLAEWIGLCPPERTALVNMYGITETTVHVTWHRLTREEVLASANCIGRPLPETHVHVLDAGFAQAPVGVPGELHVGGTGVCAGYLGRPELTASRFLPDPFSPEPGGRLYRTGDLGRWLPDGTLEYLGRNDTQVQVRGFRVEPGEIEARLLAHPGVREAAVVARETADGWQELVAYLVPAGVEGLDEAAVRDHLRESLPNYMVPTRLVEIAALPLTPNGKLDRALLPVPEASGRRAGGPPRTPLERDLARIWERVLGRDGIGLHDGFFELGGHSLTAVRLAACIRDELGCEVSLQDLFAAPTVAALAALAAGRSGAAPSSGPIPRLPRAVTYALSHAQRRLWVLHQLEEGTAAYNVPMAYRLEGPLDVRALEAALRAVVDRHESLRTGFRTVDGEPRQAVARTAGLSLPRVDLAGLPPAAATVEGRSWAERIVRLPFDLGAPPLLRAVLVRTALVEHLLVLSLHHIVGDGWSMGVLAREVLAGYEAFCRGEGPVFEPLPIQYRDYAAWQNDLLARGALEEHRVYWHERLAGELPVLDLPADFPRPPARSFRGGAVCLDLGPAAAVRWKAFAHGGGASLFMSLLIAAGALIYRYTGQEDLVLGSPVAARNHPDLEGQVGFYTNTLALRLRIAPREGLASHLGRIGHELAAAYDHQIYPFDRLVDELGLARDTRRSPLFDVMVSLQVQDRPQVRLPGLAVREMELETGMSKFDLLINADDDAGGLRIWFEYSGDLFRRERIERMARHFGRLLESAAEDGERPVGELDLLLPAERRQLLLGFNATARRWPPGETTLDLFAARVQADPFRTAVEGGEESLTYGELDELSDRLAAALAARGVGLEDRVGVFLGRTPRLAAALLAVLKAGAAYVPLDPLLPEERLAYLLHDSGARAVVTDPPSLGRFGELGLDVTALPPAGPGGPRREVPSEAVAYVIYTSGSTGRPKGVLCTHRCLANLLRWQAEAIPGAPRVLQFAALGFDVSLQEILFALTSGGCLVLPPEEVRHDLERLAELAAERGIELLSLPFSALRGLAAIADLSSLGALRHLVTAGEQLQIEAGLARLLAERPEMVLHNQYGPSEAHVVTAYAISAARANASRLPPIGAPIANTEVHLLDRDGDLAPVGVPGEICLAGAGLARGYLGRPDLTAERFVPHPFGRGERLYRTGDLGRRREDGEVEFLGRMDDQVKIRGFRVEPGEVEAALREHPGVHEAAVLVRARGESRQLVACYAGGPTGAPGAAELRAFLRRSLPDYMVPATFSAFPALPLSANGKVDRRALARLAQAGEAEAPARRELSTPVEETVAGAWSEVLGVLPGPDDNFFEIGGHSLLGAQVCARLREVFPVELPLRRLFEAQTVAALAAALEEDGRRAGVDVCGIAEVVVALGRLSEDEAERMLAGDRG